MLLHRHKSQSPCEAWGCTTGTILFAKEPRVGSSIKSQRVQGKSPAVLMLEGPSVLGGTGLSCGEGGQLQ